MTIAEGEGRTEHLWASVVAGCHAPIINAGLVVGHRAEGLKSRHLRIRQPEKITHSRRSIFAL
jgi:hypothetical protein